jgi:hypothetical protein
MSGILEMLKGLNLTDEQMEQLKELTTETTDPMTMMAKIQDILPGDVLQSLMMQFMQDPSAIINMAKEMGVDDETIDSISSNIPQ